MAVFGVQGSATRRAPSLAATASAMTLGLAAACWIFTVRTMHGMDMGVATRLGSFPFFVAVWTSMMAAMMLPGAVPAIVTDAVAARRIRAVPVFVGSYVGVWALVGVAVFALYRPHSTLVAGLIVIAAGTYELTPLKQHFRRSCRAERPRPIRYAAHCVGSSIGLMLIMVSLGVMSATWMTVVACIHLGQKLLPPNVAVDVALALAICGLGALILVAPSAVHGLTPSMPM